MNDKQQDANFPERRAAVRTPSSGGIDLGEGQSFGVSQRDGRLYIGDLEALARAGVPTNLPPETRRWEIFIPIFYLDSGDPVQPDVFEEIAEKLEERFGQVMLSESVSHLRWSLEEEDDFKYRFDETVRKFSVSAENTWEICLFFRDYKTLLQGLLKNENGVVIESYPIETM